MVISSYLLFIHTTVMEAWAFTKQLAEMANGIFDDGVLGYLLRWAISEAMAQRVAADPTLPGKP